MALSFVGDMQSIGAGSYLIIRPGVGEIWIMKGFCLSGQGGSRIHYYDGTNYSEVGSGTSAILDNATLDLPIDNDQYVRLLNGTGGASILGYRGYKL